MVTPRKKGAKMGRPAGPPENVRRNRLVVFVTDVELAKLHRMTEDSGRPLGTVAYELLGRALRSRR